MALRDPRLRLGDIVDAAETVIREVDGVAAEALAADIRKRWIVERGLEIVSEASRHLPAEFKDRHPNIPWRKVAAIGNVLRHAYETVAPDILWHVVQVDLPLLQAACRAEMDRLGPA